MPKVWVAVAGIALYVAISLMHLASGSARTAPTMRPAKITSCEIDWNTYESEQRHPHYRRTEVWLRQITCQTHHAWQRFWG